ncbi:hydrogenase nickel incorporation protein HypB [Fluoribacter dumoffii]|uniref:hydrogenase nickel incorporation protein HypB n=1 Tax=Fluoribacter dumoffii TaxID=463 RepID=UPI002243A616|nr:hydrogenase nickel incorporation protein HypB [Fluoribacter dumoffii]MCW8419294.1 hydrogenase nickel incorporation protein HypB [Fluoribacter dumoffii]MCW8452831.1 hydrogenase nickel incorporation protein HypB [Fluoribacter dumoffii]MCW8459919.1 hydrogenase nickel incorporation protein HypB [Fluoribacter dumoffii]MCW8483397.1 hydrogenase nickel incorporation protein HypB [Fluoribacter dumoffii]
MCGICGCSEEQNEMHHHEHHTHGSMSHHDDEHLIHVEQSILAQNQQFALNNKQYLIKKNILALNLMSSPGSGKTTLLAKTIEDLKTELESAVLVGDQQTDYDAKLIKASGGNALQINTGKTCHLDAHRVSHALENIPLKENSLLFIENVGNLVCPALFDLGEQFKVVILSVAEGENKPLKYPDMFRCADLLLITKMDLLPYVNFNLDKCIEYARQIKPTIEILTLSAMSGDGLLNWYGWLRQKLLDTRGNP